MPVILPIFPPGAQYKIPEPLPVSMTTRSGPEITTINDAFIIMLKPVFPEPLSPDMITHWSRFLSRIDRYASSAMA